MKVLSGLKYSKDHEWVRLEGKKAVIGITDFAQHSLGDIVYVELPEAGKRLKAGDAFAVVESVKAASDVYTPLSGKVVEVNGGLDGNPARVNEDPYEAWFVVLEADDVSQADSLMDGAEYEKFCAKES